MTQPRAWYREPLVWLIITFPLIAVIAGFTTMYLAYTTRDGMVVDDYYQKGKEINQSLARDVAAAQRALHAKLWLDATQTDLTVQLSAAAGNQPLPETLMLRWLHATRAGFDRSQMLTRSPDGRYHVAFPALAPGHWYVQIEAQDWRLQGSLRIPGEVRLELVPPLVAGPPAE